MLFRINSHYNIHQLLHGEEVIQTLKFCELYTYCMYKLVARLEVVKEIKMLASSLEVRMRNRT